MNLKIIADNDPGGDLSTAYATMAAETVLVPTDRLVTYRIVGRDAGFSASVELEKQVDNWTLADALPSWVKESLEDEGININDPPVAALIGQMVDEVVFTSASATAILAMRNRVTQTYPGLKEGHLQNARRMKAVVDADQSREEEAEVAALLPSFPNLTVSELRSVRARRLAGGI